MIANPGSKKATSKPKANTTSTMVEQVLIMSNVNHKKLTCHPHQVKTLRLTSSKKRSVGADVEGEGKPRRKTEPIIRKSLQADFILIA